MPLCGFNKKMIQGLSGFHGGLVEHGIVARSEKKKQSFDETMQKELNDMSRFMEYIPEIENPEMREITEALTLYASAFYKLVNKNGINNYKETIDFLNKFFWEMDNKYYSELEGQKDDMEKLAVYLNAFIEKSKV